jgi:hypothetical protein
VRELSGASSNVTSSTPSRFATEEKSIKLLAGLSHLEVLTKELAGYEMKVNQKTGHDAYSNDPRETPHDGGKGVARWRAKTPATARAGSLPHPFLLALPLCPLLVHFLFRSDTDTRPPWTRPTQSRQDVRRAQKANY